MQRSSMAVHPGVGCARRSRARVGRSVTTGVIGTHSQRQFDAPTKHEISRYSMKRTGTVHPNSGHMHVVTGVDKEPTEMTMLSRRTSVISSKVSPKGKPRKASQSSIASQAIQEAPSGGSADDTTPDTSDDGGGEAELIGGEEEEEDALIGGGDDGGEDAFPVLIDPASRNF